MGWGNQARRTDTLLFLHRDHIRTEYLRFEIQIKPSRTSLSEEVPAQRTEETIIHHYGIYTIRQLFRILRLNHSIPYYLNHTMITRLNSIVGLCICIGISSCSRQEQKPTDLVTFPLRGEVVAIDTAKNRVTVDHEEIPDYMMAMTMPFKVKDPSLLRGLHVGDTVQGTLAVSRTESWLETITVVGKGEEVETLMPEQIQLRHQFQPGEILPDLPFLNQDGKTVRFSDFRGRVLAFTFIYTRCPLPDFCILMSNNFAKIQKSLSKDRSLDRTWHLISISFDPKFDRPKTLKAYAENYGADLSTWDFVTDPDTTGRSILKLADGLDLTYADDEGLIQHNLRTVVLDGEGKLVKLIKGNEWKAEELSGEIRKTINR